MAEAVELAIRLQDQVSGPAKAMANAFARWQNAIKGASSAAQAAASTHGRLRDAAGRFVGTGNGAAAAARGLARGFEEIARAAAAAQKSTDKVRQSAEKLSRGKGLLAAAMVQDLRGHAQGNERRGKLKPTRADGGFMSDLLGGLGIGAGFSAATALAGVLQGAARAAFDLGMALARVAANAALAFGQAVAGAAMFREANVLAFKSLSKGASDGVKEFERVKKLAFEFGAPLQDTVQQFQAMQRMGFGMEQIERLFKRFQDLKTIGVGADQISRAVLAITQIRATGKLQGDELMQLAEAGVSVDEVYKALGKRLGKTVPEIIKLKEAGQITAADAIAGIEDAMSVMAGGKAPGQLGKDFANTTITGLVQRFKNLGPHLFDEIASRVMPAFKRLQPIVEDVFKMFESPAASKAFDAIGAVISGLVETVRSAWPIVKAFGEGVGKGFVQGWDAAKKGLDAFSKGAGGNKQMMADLAVVARGAGMALGLMAASLMAVAAGLANAEKAARLAFEPLNKISGLGPLGGMGGGKGQGFGDLFGFGGGLIPTASSLLGNQFAGGFGEMASAEVNTSNTLTVSVSGVGKTDQELANLIRREAERIFTQKLASLPI